MPFYLSYLLCLAEDFMFCSSIDFILERKIINKRKLMIFPASLLAAYSLMIIPIPIISHIGALISGVVMLVWYADVKILSGFILYIISFIIHSAIHTSFMWLPQALITNPVFLISAFIISTGIFYLLVKFLPIRKLYHCLTERSIIPRILLFNTVILLEIYNIYFNVDSTAFLDKIALNIAIILFMLYINVYSIHNHIKIKNQKAMLDAYNIWLPIVEQLIMQIRTIQHNYDNELQTFKAMPLVHKNIDELKKAIMDYVRQIIDTEIPMTVSLYETPGSELRQCIEELNGKINNINNKYTVNFN